MIELILNIDCFRMTVDIFFETIGCGHSAKACLTLWPLFLWPFVAYYFVAIRRVAIWHCGQVTHTRIVVNLFSNFCERNIAF